MMDLKYCVMFMFMVVILPQHTTTTIDQSESSNSSHVINNNDTNNVLICKPNNNETCASKAKKHALNDLSTLAFYYVTIVLTVIGYALVLPPAYKKRQPSSVFIFSLAFADSFIGFVIVPIKITEVYGATWQTDIVWCRVVNAVTIFGIALAGTNVVAVSLDRLLYFTIPLKYRDVMTIRRAILFCFSAFVLSLPALLPAVGIGGQHTDERLKFCAFKFSLTREYMWSVGIAYFLLPSALVIAIQIKIMLLTNEYYSQHRDFIKTNPHDKVRDAQMKLSMKREIRIQRMFLLIILLFFVCWGPFVAGIICNLVAVHLITPFFIQVMRIMLFINSFVNPLVMFVSSDNFCSLINKLTRRLVRKENGTEHSHSHSTTTMSQVNHSYTDS